MDLVELNEASVDDLYGELGSLLLGRGPNAGTLDSSRMREFGQRHFDQMRAALGAALCNSDGTARLPGNDLGNVAAAILAYQAAEKMLTDSQEKALLLAAIVLKTGLSRFCRTLVYP